jgi:hypothetical protein
MLGLVFGMLRTRRGPAVTLALLAMFATASAVAGPGYLAAVDRAVVANAVADATPDQRGITLNGTVDHSGNGAGPSFDLLGPALVRLPGFTEVYSSDFLVVGVGSQRQGSLLSYRQDVCAHLVMVSGRCLSSIGEIVIGTRTAATYHLTAGSTVTLTYTTLDEKGNFLTAGAPTPLTIAGIYRPRDPSELYWGPRDYFYLDAAGDTAQPVFASQTTFASMDHQTENVQIDAFAGPDSITTANEADLRNQIQQLNLAVAGVGGQVQFSTSIPQLLTGIDRGRRLAHQVVPVAAVPLVALAWFVIFLAAGYGTEGRRFELGLVALRGVRLPARWWLAAGEDVIPIVTGTVAGYFAGRLAVSLLAGWRLGQPARADGLSWALVAGAGAVLAALLAQSRPLFTPVAQLLRRVPARLVGWRGLAVEALIVVLAVLVAIQLRVSGGQLTGVGLLEPALVILGCAVLAARAVAPLASWYGARALRRGRLGGALAAVHLGRRPGSQRLFVLLAAAVGLLGFAVTATDVAAQARTIRAQVDTGAVRVLTVAASTRGQLLSAVRATDPAGRYAMAAAEMPDGAPNELPKLAVDSSRLATASIWRPDFGPLSADQVAARLHPTGTPAALTVSGKYIGLDLSIAQLDPRAGLKLTLALVSPSGVADSLEFSELRQGDAEYLMSAPDCAAGCRLIGFNLNRFGSVGQHFEITILGLTGADENGTQVSQVPLGKASNWRGSATAKMVDGAAGLTAVLDNPNGVAQDGWVKPADTPYPLPVVATSKLRSGATLAGLDGNQIAVNQVGQVSGLPRLGDTGALVDLEYADRMATDGGGIGVAQVWLGPAAPADVVARLAAHGLVVVGTRSVGQERVRLDRQAPALALWFHLLAAGFATVLAAGAVWLVATVDRRRRAEDLAALRVQGLNRRQVGRAAVGGGLTIVLTALVAGLISAGVAWWVAGYGLPVFVDPSSIRLPAWPRPLPVLAVWLGAGVVLGGVALITGANLRRTVKRHIEGTGL